VYAPNSSVCLAAEHLGQFSKTDTFKLVRVSEQNVSLNKFNAMNSNDIDSFPSENLESPKGWSVQVDHVQEMCPSFMLDLVKASKKTHLLTFVQSRLRSRSKSKLGFMQTKATTALKSKATSKFKRNNALDDVIINLVNLRDRKSNYNPNDINFIKYISESLLNKPNTNN